jgi:hypothetical protein
MVKTTTTLRSSKKYLEPNKLAEALMAADEILERCQLNYFLMDMTAKTAVIQALRNNNGKRIRNR